jgi:hypothetical protein
LKLEEAARDPDHVHLHVHGGLLMADIYGSAHLQTYRNYTLIDRQIIP